MRDLIDINYTGLNLVCLFDWNLFQIVFFLFKYIATIGLKIIGRYRI